MARDTEGKGSNSHPDEGAISVLYENTDVVVINKPSGMLVHEDGRSTEPTVVDWLRAHAPESEGVGEPGRTPKGVSLERSGVVHRLDADTSGVLILAKTQEAFEYLKAQFHERRAKKEYRAFVYGSPKERWGTIRRTIGRSPRDFRLRSCEPGAKGLLRPAVTHWEVLAQSGTHAYLKVVPETGRTHQIRVHLKAIGKPIVHDSLYAPPAQVASKGLGFTRLALHAYSLFIMTPDGVPRTFSAPLPQDFERAAALVANG